MKEDMKYLLALPFGFALYFSLTLSPFLLALAFCPDASEHWMVLFVFSLFGGLILSGTLVISGMFFWEALTKKEDRGCSAGIAFNALCIAASIVERWISRIVFERVPATGENPDNIAAIFTFGTVWYVIRGLLAGLAITLVVAVFYYAARSICGLVRKTFD
jgi:hypothetical protein